MNLRGTNRLRLFLMGVAAAGMCGPAQFVQADGNQAAPAGSTRPVAANKKSEVMRQLELLYEKDGREMPELNTDIRPVPTSGTPNSAETNAGQPAASSQVAPPTNSSAAPPVNVAPNGLRIQQLPATQNASPAPTVAPAEKAPSKNPVLSFFKKLVPGRKDPKPTSAPADYRPDVPPVPPAIAGNPHQQNTRSPGRPEYAPARIGGVATAAASAALPSLDATPHSPFELPVSRNAESLPQPLVAGSDIPPAPMSESPGVAADAVSLPALLAQPQTTEVVTSAEPPALDTTAATTPGEQPALSPFTEMSEQEADKKLELNPYTGLTLNEETATKSPPADASLPATPDAAAKPVVEIDDPFAEELRKLGVVPEEKKLVEKDPKLQSPSSQSPTFDGIADETTREKMKKIHERGGMKGLKGFCPVTLHDDRELVDAKPEFHSTYRGQKFHFANVEAKLKFDQEPARYAPAAYGADVVALTRDKDVVEGSLDYAAWFKGRLYLFGSEEAHTTFVADPALYATPIGIE